MNILILTSWLSIGGTERAAQVFAQYLHRIDGISVIFGASDISWPRRNFLEQEGIEVVNMAQSSPDEIVGRYNIDVVFGHCYNTKAFAHFQNVLRIQEVVFAGCYDNTAQINLAISDALAYKIKLLRPSSNIVTLYYPQDIDTWSSCHVERAGLYEKYRIPADRFVVSRVARPEPSKWDFLFIPSVKWLIDRNPDIHLLLVGCPLLYKVLLWTYKDNISYVSPTSDDHTLAEIYTLTDIFFHTAQRGETFGNVNAEAMFFGKPVITHSTPFLLTNGRINMFSDNAQIEVVEHGINGFVGCTPDSVIEYIELLKNDHALYDSIALENTRKVCEKYAAQVIVRNFLEIIESYRKGTLKFDTTDDLRVRCATYLKFPHTIDRGYSIQKSFYGSIEYIYLVIRKLLRQVGVDIENIDPEYFTYLTRYSMYILVRPRLLYFFLKKYFIQFARIRVAPLRLKKVDFDIDKSFLRIGDGEILIAIWWDIELKSSGWFNQKSSVLLRKRMRQILQYCGDRMVVWLPLEYMETDRLYEFWLTIKLYFKTYLRKQLSIGKYGDAFFFRSMKWLQEFVDLYEWKGVFIVSNASTIEKAVKIRGLDIVWIYEIPWHNAFESYGSIYQDIVRILKGCSREQTRVIVSGWPFAKVLVYDLTLNNDYICHDVGALFDIYS